MAKRKQEVEETIKREEQIKVKIEQQDGYPDKNKITGYLPYSGEAPARVPAARQSAPARVPESIQGAAGGKSRPWQR